MVTLADIEHGSFFELDGILYRKQERPTGGREGYYAYGIEQGESFCPARLIHLSCGVTPVVDE